MSEEIVERVLGSARYRDVDRALVARVAAEEGARARNLDDAVKRVKRRLHQAVGAYRTVAGRRTSGPWEAAWTGEWTDLLRDDCRRALLRHASTRERLPVIDVFYGRLWQALGGPPASVLDLACGVNPLALPFMKLGGSVEYLACDSDRRVLDEVETFLGAVEQPHRTWACDLVAGPPQDAADVALLLKTVPILDRQDPGAAARVLAGLRTRAVVVSFPLRSLGGRGALGATYRTRMAGLAAEVGERFSTPEEVEIGSELVYVLRAG